MRNSQGSSSVIGRILLFVVCFAITSSLHAFEDFPQAGGSWPRGFVSFRSSSSLNRHFVIEAPIAAGTDARMIRAAWIAERRAERRSIRLCWRYVKTALLQAGAVSSYPRTHYAKHAGRELMQHGFTKLRIRNPYRAPLGSVLVYGGRGAGHVEIRTQFGFVSDFRSRRPVRLPLLGIYAKAA